MKHTIIIIVLSAIIISAGAKTIIDRTDATRANVISRDVFRNTQLDIAGNRLVFKGLPVNIIEYRVLNAAGKTIASGTLNKKNKTIETTKLPDDCYTISLQQGAQNKLFGYQTGIVVKAPRHKPLKTGV